MSNTHKITVSILTCNRIEAVRENLDRLARQTLFPNFEILVVDNNSTDGTPEVLKTEYPHVKHIRMTENTGCAGRNAGFANASAPLVVTLDDDVYLHRDDELERILEFFDQHLNVSALNFKVLFYDTKELVPFNWFHPRRSDLYMEETFETDYISEGAVAFRTEIFKSVGDYPADFFISHEGYDLAYRMLNHSLSLYYSGMVEVLHKCAHEQRPSWRNAYYDTRNYIWLLVKHFPFYYMVPQIIYRLASTFMFCLLRKQIVWYFRAVWDAIKGIRAQWAKRQPLSPEAMLHLKHIRRFKPSIFYKIKDFLLRTRTINKVFKTETK